MVYRTTGQYKPRLLTARAEKKHNASNLFSTTITRRQPSDTLELELDRANDRLKLTVNQSRSSVVCCLSLSLCTKKRMLSLVSYFLSILS